MTNTCAIFHLLAAQNAMTDAGAALPGIAFAGDLIRHLEADKPGVVTIGDERYPFTPDQVRVNGVDVKIGELHLTLNLLGVNDNGEYETVMLVDEVNLLGETVPVMLLAA